MAQINKTTLQSSAAGRFGDQPKRRLAGPLAAALLCSLFLASPSFAQNDANEAGTPETVLSKADGLPIHITYISADPAKVEGELESAPVVILLHGANSDRLVWENKPTNFRKRTTTQIMRDGGYAIVTVDMRGHGESQLDDGKKINNNDYPKMLGDIEAVKEFLMEEHQQRKLNINKLGIVAADAMTPIAMQYAAYDWQKPDYDDAPIPSRRTPRGRDVRALALLSPVNQTGRVSAVKAANFLRNPRVEVALFIAMGKDDRLDDGLAARLAKQFRAQPVDKPAAEQPIGDDTAFVPPYLVGTYPTPLRGTDLIGEPNVRTDLHLMQFLDKALKGLEIPWRNRQSRIAR